MTRRGLFGSIAGLLAARKLPAKTAVNWTAADRVTAAAKVRASNLERNLAGRVTFPASEYARTIEIPRELFDDFTYSFKGPS